MKAIIILAFWTVASAISPAQNTDRTADKEALRALAARYEVAINQGSLAGLQDSVAPEVSAVFMTGVESKGLEAMQKYYDEIKGKLGSGGSYTVKFVPDDTDFHGNIAVAHGTSDEAVVLGNGKRITYRSLWTAVLEKNDGQWKALRLHVSIDPIDNAFVRMKLDLTKWMHLAIGGLIGLVAGLLGFKIISKRGTRQA